MDILLLTSTGAFAKTNLEGEWVRPIDASRYADT